jgi:hypothetical protein
MQNLRSITALEGPNNQNTKSNEKKKQYTK